MKPVHIMGPQMLVLGSTADAVGRELELLTCRILKVLGWTNVSLNTVGPGGEIDVDAERVLQVPGEIRTEKLICECKARQDALPITDWLKFMGKVCMRTIQAGTPVHGCLIALNGVNGYVQADYQIVRDKKYPVTVVSGDRLAEYMTQTHGLVSAETVVEKVKAEFDQTPKPPTVVLYDDAAYWLLTYPDARYTLREANGDNLVGDRVERMRPLIAEKAAVPVDSYIDLHTEQRHLWTAHMAKKIVVALLVTGGGGIMNFRQMTALQKGVTADDMFRALAVLSTTNLIDDVDGNMVGFADAVETDVNLLAMAFKILTSNPILPEVLGTKWYDEHVSDALLDYICHIQGQLRLEADQRSMAIDILRWSPFALRYALEPDPMITNHRFAESALSESVEYHDALHFMTSLWEALVLDVQAPESSSYFAGVRKIDKVSTKTMLRITKDGKELPAVEIPFEIVLLEFMRAGQWVHTRPIYFRSPHASSETGTS